MTWAPKEPISQSPILIDITPTKEAPPPSHVNLFARFKAFKAGDGAKSSAPQSPVSVHTILQQVDQLQLYLDMPVEPQTTNVLDWWAENGRLFPHVALMARQFLSAPATSASAERLFSLAGANFSDHRKNMTDAHLADLLFAKINVFMNRRFQAKFMAGE